MLSLPEEDVNALWQKMGDKKSWTDFMKTVMSQGGKSSHMDSLMVDLLVRDAYDFKLINFSFPETPASLAQILNVKHAGD